MECPECGSGRAERVSTETKARPERVGSARTVVSCPDCGEVC